MRLKNGKNNPLQGGKIITILNKGCNMAGFNYELFDKYFEQKYKTNKEFLDVIKKLGVDVSEEAVKKWRQHRAVPKTKDIPAVATALGVTEQDLFDPSKKELIAREELNKSPKKYINEFPELQVLRDMYRLPFIPIGAGAEAVLNVDLLDSIYIPIELLPRDFEPKNVIVGRVIGDSMEPEFYENDIIFFDMVNGRDVMLMDGIYLVRYGDTVQVKSVQFLGNGDIRIISFNDNYPPIQPIKELGVDWEILGKPFFCWHAKIWARLQEKEPYHKSK